MAVNISSYLFKKVLRISAFNISTNELYGSLTLFNNLTFANGQEQTDVTAGGVKIAQLDYGKTATLTGESPLINDTILALQSGTTIETVMNTSNIAIPDTITITSDAGIAKYGGTGSVNSEIKFAYLLDSKGSPIKTFTQDAVASTGKFSYSAATRELTFNTGEVPDGSKILIYTYPVVSEAKLITNDSNKFSKSARILVDIQVADVCDESNEYLMRVVFENGKFSGTYEWAIDGQNPAVQSFEVSSMLPCGDSKLWDAYIFDMDDVIVTTA